MTIIQHHTTRSSNSLVVIALIFAFVAVSGWSIYYYNRTVSLKSDIRTGMAEIEQMRAENAELQNKIAQELDAQRLELMASELQLEKDKKPNYVPVSAQWDLVSHL